MSYFVVRDYSHTDKQCLLKVLSGNMVSLQSAVDWAESMKSSDISKAKTSRQKKHLKRTDYYVIQNVEENVELKAERFMFQKWKISFSVDDITTICKMEKSFDGGANIHMFEGQGRSMNEAFDDCRLKIWEWEVKIPDGWRRLNKNEYVKTTDLKYDGYYWVKATDTNDIWDIENLKYKTMFIRKA